MRVEPCAALSVSIAVHAGLLAFVPAPAVSRSFVGAAAGSPPVLTARLKDTLASGRASRSSRLNSARAERSFGEPPSAMVISHWARSADASKQAARVDNPVRFYPPEAIEKGLEGETVVMLRFGDDGGLLDAQIAKSSGHAILDQAALRAIRSTPRFAPGSREILLPVTFALH